MWAWVQVAVRYQLAALQPLWDRMPTNRRKWLHEHSFSVTCAVLFALSSAGFFCVDAGHLYDTFNMLQGIFGGGVIVAVLSRHLYEKDADPTKDPDECE